MYNYFIFWGAFLTLPANNDTSEIIINYLANIGIGMILSFILTVASLVVGIVSIVNATKFNKMSRETGNSSSRGMNTAGLILAIIGVISSSFSLLGTSCIMCTGCLVTSASETTTVDDYSDFSDDEFDFNFEFDDTDVL